jgi:L-malate glycosyltransferase
MHILIIASWYKSANNPTAGSFIEEQARMLQSAGHKVSVIHAFINGTFVDTIKRKKTFCQDNNDRDIITAKISSNVIIPKYRKHSYIRLYKKTKKYLENYIAQNGKPDIIHSHALFMGGVIGYYISKEFKIRQFHTEHTSGLIFNPAQYSKADIKLLNTVYCNCKKVFFVSNFALNQVKALYNLELQNLFVLHNIVDCIFFDFNQIVIKNDVFNFISIGNLIKRKHYDFLLQSWAKFVEHDKKSILTIAGSGSELNALKKLLDLLNLHQTVKIIPRLSRDEVKSYIENCNVLLSTAN